MTSPQPDQRRRDRRRPDAGAVTETFTMGPPRWFRVLFSRNPLIRRSDRIEALALALAVVVTLLAAPVAAAVGTAIYDSRSRSYAEQAQSRFAVSASVVAGPARSDSTWVQARWFAAGAEHTGRVQSEAAPKPGEVIDIWVNKDGTYAGPPHMPAAREAVLVALAIWLNAATVALALFAGTRALCNRSRAAGWRPELVHGLGEGKEHPSRH
ncbi:Rv1733c family protein [Mycobacterium asiaticum]|uniref:Transmembrane protein n=1 Tax=Mycobacterium asiaticum TaxID=1790 RepID=A0A1A3N956_MYCAS|nr:hypothetical protein [Mycobacterium asiaticum]OBK16902.1 hypothetical protein A5636_24105 [Mycobacterium asiaticum]